MDAEVVTPTVDPPVPDAPAEVSLADHAAQFDPKRPEQRETPDQPEPVGEPTRHRAQSQKAGPKDVPRINELTRKLREAEAELQKYRSAPPVAAPPTASTTTATTPPAEKFTFPGYEAYLGQHPDATYEDWQDAKLDARDAWRDQQREKTQHQAQQTESERTAQEAERALMTAHTERVHAFAATTPDYYEKLDAALADTPDVPPLLGRAILEDDNGPKILYHLLTHPSVMDEMRFATDGKPISASSVALLRRRLNTFVQAAPTESAAGPRFTHIAPRPPNSVRTGPLNTGPELPGDGASIAAHAKAFGPKRR